MTPTVIGELALRRRDELRRDAQLHRPASTARTRLTPRGFGVPGPPAPQRCTQPFTG